MWTLDELVDRVGRALAAGYPGAPNGRVRDVPDRRAIRWYTTTGLVDRPLGMRGRSALYGPRHLLQIVALKWRQAEGLSLAEIQGELTGASDETLSGIARVSGDLLATGDAPATKMRPPDRFWAVGPRQIFADVEVVAHGDAADPSDPAADRYAPATVESRTRLLTETAAPVAGVRLGSGAILVLPAAAAPPSPADLADIAEAARPLLRLLTDRGLLNTDDGSPS